jgi:hypothetical protein
MTDLVLKTYLFIVKITKASPVDNEGLVVKKYARPAHR